MSSLPQSGALAAMFVQVDFKVATNLVVALAQAWRIQMLVLGLFAALASPFIAFAETEPGKQKSAPTIRNITIKVREIFDDPNLDLFYRAVNSLKINTREEVVRRELLFAEGDKYDEFLVAESERRIRSIRYLRRAEIQTVFDGDFVDLEVSVQDTWTLIPQIKFSSGTGNDGWAAGIAEGNLAGLGLDVGASYERQDERETTELSYNDERVLGSENRLAAGYLDRSDGEIAGISFGQPFRTLVQRQSWQINWLDSDIVSRLFENGDERFIFRKDSSLYRAQITLARGVPEERLHRYTFGYEYLDDDFSPADEDDFDDLDLDPIEDEISLDPNQLADDRRFSGPTFFYQDITPDFLSINYIDRFDRVEDYNLGLVYSFGGTLAPEQPRGLLPP